MLRLHHRPRRPPFPLVPLFVIRHGECSEKLETRGGRTTTTSTTTTTSSFSSSLSLLRLARVSSPSRLTLSLLFSTSVLSSPATLCREASIKFIRPLVAATLQDGSRRLATLCFSTLSSLSASHTLSPSFPFRYLTPSAPRIYLSLLHSTGGRGRGTTDPLLSVPLSSFTCLPLERVGLGGCN